LRPVLDGETVEVDLVWDEEDETGVEEGQ